MDTSLQSRVYHLTIGRVGQLTTHADLREAYLWVVMSDSSKTTSSQLWSVNITLISSPLKSDPIFDHYHYSGFCMV